MQYCLQRLFNKKENTSGGKICGSKVSAEVNFLRKVIQAQKLSKTEMSLIVNLFRLQPLNLN